MEKGADLILKGEDVHKVLENFVDVLFRRKNTLRGLGESFFSREIQLIELSSNSRKPPGKNFLFCRHCFKKETGRKYRYFFRF